VSGLNVRRLASLLVVALFVLPLLAPLIAAVPARAQPSIPFNVTNFVVTPGGELGFIFNRSGLGSPFEFAPTLFFWASKNSIGILTSDDFLLATLFVGTAKVVFGTLVVNETIGGWLGAGISKNVYLKVTTTPFPGPFTPAQVTSNFTLIVDPATIERVLKVQNAPDDAPTSHFAGRSYTAPFHITNRPEFVLNLSAIGIGLGRGMTLVDNAHIVRVDAVNFTLIHERQTLFASNGTKHKARVAVLTYPTYLLASLRLSGKQAADTNLNVLRLNGTLREFPLLSPTDLITINGTSVGHQAFSLTATVFNGSTRVLNIGYAKVDRGEVFINATGTPVTGIIFNHTVASIGWTRPVRIYPTVTFSFLEGPTAGDNPSGVRNVGDRVSITLRNYKPGASIKVRVFFFVAPAFTEKLPVENLSPTITVPPSGTVTFSGFIPDNPYGGRRIVVTVNVSAGVALTSPPLGAPINATIAVSAFNNDGALISGLSGGVGSGVGFVPGELLFIRGRGFLVGTPVVQLVNVTGATTIEIDMSGFIRAQFMDTNGSMGLVVQIPPELRLYNGNTVYLRVFTTALSMGRAPFTTTAVVTFGTMRVFIEPSAKITRILPTPDVSIEAGARRFPSTATWEEAEDPGRVRFRILVYHAPQTALRFNVTLVTPATVPVETIATNFDRTGIGSLSATFPVPEAPFGSYRVRVASGATFLVSSATPRLMLNITATVAAVDPADNITKKRVFLSTVVNLTIKGVGFEAGKAVKFDIPMIGVNNALLLRGPELSPTAVSATAKGSFEGWINLPTLITAPGTYSIRIHQSPAEAEILITIGVPPPFTVRVVTGAAKFADLPLDIWVLAFYGGSLASETQVTSVSLAVYLRRVDGGITTFTLPPTLTPPTPVFPGGPAIFYARFNTPPEALGRDLLILATVRAKFSPIAAVDTASDVTSVAIPPVRITDMLEQILVNVVSSTTTLNNIITQLITISTRLDSLEAALGSAVTTVRGDIAAAEGRIRGDIAGVRALVLEVSNNVSQAILVSGQNNAILDKLDKMNATLVSVSGGVARISTDVDGLAALIRAANLSISKVVVDQAGNVIAALSNSEGRIVGAISALSTDVDGLATLIRAAIAADAEAFDRVMRHLTDISGKLDTLITALETAVTTIKGDIAAAEDRIRGDIAALVLEVNTNVGLVAQAVLTVADQNNAILDRLGGIDAKLTGVSSGVAKLSTDVDGLAALIRAANLSISKVVVDQAGRVIAALSDSEGRIVGAISTNAKTLSDLITAVEGRVRGDVKAVSDALATFQSGAFSKLDAISGSVDAARADLARLRTDVAAMASVVAGIQTIVSRVDTNVGGLVDTAKTIATTVDSINKAVPGLATKADVSNAQTAITGAVDKAKSDLQSAVESTEDTASTSSRNWGAINSILVIIAIAILAYSTFVARRA
jgi:hypothetical protein